jgi:hypothetical protein
VEDQRLSDKELLEKYQDFLKKGIRSKSTWWGYKLVKEELKRRGIYII